MGGEVDVDVLSATDSVESDMRSDLERSASDPTTHVALAHIVTQQHTMHTRHMHTLLSTTAVQAFRTVRMVGVRPVVDGPAVE